MSHASLLLTIDERLKFHGLGDALPTLTEDATLKQVCQWVGDVTGEYVSAKELLDDAAEEGETAGEARTIALEYAWDMVSDCVYGQHGARLGCWILNNLA